MSMPLARFLRVWEYLCTDGIPAEGTKYIRDVLDYDELAARPELQDIVETGMAVDFIDARAVWDHHTALQKPGLTSQQRIALNEAEAERKRRYREQKMGRGPNG